MNADKVMDSRQPLVSVLTPVYNGERYLVECIHSVLKQTYKNWEYIIVNNCSNDRTFDIINEYARRDSRIQTFNNQEFVGAIENHNIALSRISPQSKYCKFVHADDLLFPTCLEEMVRVAEAHPSVGIVSSYQLCGRWVRCDGLPYPSEVVPGKEVIRAYFLQGTRLFVTMSGFLLRSDLVRSRAPLLNDKFLFADTEVYFTLLQDHDYGFVHQVLTMWRVHDESLNSFPIRHNQWTIENVYLTKEYGPIYLSPDEYEPRLKESLEQYYRWQGNELFHFRDNSFWQYHRTTMNKIGLPLSPMGLAKGAMLQVAEIILDPIRTAVRQFQKVIGREL